MLDFNQEENWKFIENHPDYMVSDLGRVLSFKRSAEILKPYPTSKGYLLVDLDSKAYSVHRLSQIAFDFVDNFKNLQVNHLNSIKTDNRQINLEWCTNQENSDHSWNNGRAAAKGSEQGNSRLVEEQVVDIKSLLSEKRLSQREISNLYGVSKSTIGKISAGKNWAWL